MAKELEQTRVSCSWATLFISELLLLLLVVLLLLLLFIYLLLLLLLLLLYTCVCRCHFVCRCYHWDREFKFHITLFTYAYTGVHVCIHIPIQEFSVEL